MRALLSIMTVVLLAASAPASLAQTSKAHKSTEANKRSSAASSARPVDFTLLGITPDKQNVAYRIKVNTNNPIEEVHLALKEMDDSGKVVENTTVVWQNIVKSKRQPIESGKTYQDQTALDPGATKAECSLKEVIFKDGTRWSAR
jgi:hypothetical protein